LSEKFRLFVILVSIRSWWIHLSTLSEFAGPLHRSARIITCGKQITGRQVFVAPQNIYAAMNTTKNPVMGVGRGNVLMILFIANIGQLAVIMGRRDHIM